MCMNVEQRSTRKSRSPEGVFVLCGTVQCNTGLWCVLLSHRVKHILPTAGSWVLAMSDRHSPRSNSVAYFNFHFPFGRRFPCKPMKSPPGNRRGKTSTCFLTQGLLHDNGHRELSLFRQSAESKNDEDRIWHGSVHHDYSCSARHERTIQTRH